MFEIKIDSETLLACSRKVGNTVLANGVTIRCKLINEHRGKGIYDIKTALHIFTPNDKRYSTNTRELVDEIHFDPKYFNQIKMFHWIRHGKYDEWKRQFKVPYIMYDGEVFWA
jgi:hypothetical protein